MAWASWSRTWRSTSVGAPGSACCNVAVGGVTGRAVSTTGGGTSTFFSVRAGPAFPSGRGWRGRRAGFCCGGSGSETGESPRQLFSRLVEEKKQQIMQTDVRLGELEAHRKAGALVAKENPDLLKNYRSDAKSA